jgi:hypothetical protein
MHYEESHASLLCNMVRAHVYPLQRLLNSLFELWMDSYDSYSIRIDISNRFLRLFDSTSPEVQNHEQNVT